MSFHECNGGHGCGNIDGHLDCACSCHFDEGLDETLLDHIDQIPSHEAEARAYAAEYGHDIDPRDAQEPHSVLDLTDEGVGL